MRHNAKTEGEAYAHLSVLWREVLDNLHDVENIGEKIVVDCTLGEGGHTEKILVTFPGIKVVAFERDPEILTVAKKRLEPFLSRVSFVNDNFSHSATYLPAYKGKISAFLYDFGISSYHFDRSERGFSYRSDQYLDMRLDKKGDVDAATIVNTYAEKKLADIFYIYGEERWAKKIARHICRVREEEQISTATQLADLVYKAIPKRYHARQIHPATRVFQALRIVVNNELEAIEHALQDSWDFLAPGGRILAISFHSLEDRIVKNTFRSLAKGCFCKPDTPVCQCDRKPRVTILTKKPITPSDEELQENKRARSAKLRICEKI